MEYVYAAQVQNHDIINPKEETSALGYELTLSKLHRSSSLFHPLVTLCKPPTFAFHQV